MADATENNNLADMIDRIINDDDQAEQSFHDYLKPKLQSAIQVNEPEDSNED